MKKWIILLAGSLLGIAVAGMFVYKAFNKPHRDIAAAKTDYSLTADELYDEFEADETAANDKYLDKVIEVRGTIEDVSLNNAGAAVYMLSAENALLGGISATLTETATSVPDSEGETVILKCRCTGKLMDVILVDCSVKNEVE
jgi:hypothetical protein